MDRTIFTDDHSLFREGARAFVEREIIPHRERFRQQGGIDRDLWLKAGKGEFLGLGIPDEYGGTGIDDYRFNVVLNEELVRAGLAYSTTFTLHTDIVAPYLSELTTPEQKQRWLPRFCSGEMVTAIAMSEPGAGSDLAAIRTTAVRSDTGWVINGSKTFITNGVNAGLVIVAARTSDVKRGSGVSLLAVESDRPGFSCGRKLEKVGQVENDTAELFFENVEVPAENLIGELDRGFHHMTDRLPQERLCTACANVAHAREILDLTLVYVRERQAFGQPVGSFQYNRFLLAELDTEVDVAQAFVDRCVDARVGGKLTPVDAAKAKWWTSDMQNRVIDACVQLFGGYGYMREYEVAQAWMDARVTKIWAGTNEIMKEIIGRSLGLGEPRQSQSASS